MIGREQRRGRIAAVLGLTLGMLIGGGSVRARAADPADPAVERVIAALREACATKPELLGVLVQGGEVNGGVLKLSGTLDRKTQAPALEAEARRIVNATAESKARMPGGASALGMATLPIRERYLAKLQAELAATPRDAEGPASDLLRQTRLDDLVFDAEGRLRLVGICINHVASLETQKAEDATPTLDPRARLAQAVHDRLKAYPLPEGVDPGVLDRIQGSGIALKDDPARRLQAWAGENPALDDLVFLDSRFDATGALVIEGLLGAPEQRAVAAALVGRPEITRDYARPGGGPPAVAAEAVASMVVLPWRLPLLSGIQQRFARASNKGTDLDDLRYCRIDRGRFVYGEQGGVKLRFDGIALIEDDPAATTRVLQAFSDEAGRLFQPARPIEYNVVNGLKAIANPRRALQAKVAAEPAVDGVRIDDLTIGSKGEATLEGVWVGESQATALDTLLRPVLNAQTDGKIVDAPAHHLTEVPVDQILRDLRAKTASALDETSLDRLSYQFPDETAPAVPTLMGATPATQLARVSAKLTEWLRGDKRTESLGAPEVRLALTGQPGSLLTELRTRVSREPALDGVWIAHAVFDESNALTLSGWQDHAGQVEQALAMIPAVAAKVWPDRPLTTPARSGDFKVVPLAARLERLKRILPYYREADGILITRACYQPDGALTFMGRTTTGSGERTGLENLIKSKVDVNAKQLVKLDLRPQTRDPEKASFLLTRDVDFLAKNAIASVPIDELDEIIFLDPDNSTAWYLRAAYFQAVGDREMLDRDLGRVKRFETHAPSLRAQRLRWITRFQGPSRLALDELESATPAVK